MPAFHPIRWLTRYLQRLRYPTLLLLTATAFAVDLFVPDLLPFADELLLGLLTAVFASLRRRRPPAGGEAA